MLLISTAALAAETLPPAPPDVDVIEFLGSIKTDGASVIEILSAIDNGLIPDLPEELPHGQK